MSSSMPVISVTVLRIRGEPVASTAVCGATSLDLGSIEHARAYEHSHGAQARPRVPRRSSFDLGADLTAIGDDSRAARLPTASMPHPLTSLRAELTKGAAPATR